MSAARAAVLAVAVALLAGCGGQRVRVTDASSGAPLRDARVTIDGGDAAPKVLLTDASGIARFQRRPPFRIAVSAEGFSGATIDAQAAGGSTYDVQLPPTWLATFLANQDREAHDQSSRKPPCHCHDRAR